MFATSGSSISGMAHVQHIHFSALSTRAPLLLTRRSVYQATNTSRAKLSYSKYQAARSLKAILRSPFSSIKRLTTPKVERDLTAANVRGPLSSHRVSNPNDGTLRPPPAQSQGSRSRRTTTQLRHGGTPFQPTFRPSSRLRRPLPSHISSQTRSHSQQSLLHFSTPLLQLRPEHRHPLSRSLHLPPSLLSTPNKRRLHPPPLRPSRASSAPRP